MWWWPSIDDMQRTRRVFESVTTKGSVYFLLGMSLLSGVVALVGVILLRANLKLLNQIPEPILLLVGGIVGFSFFFPWFMVAYFSRFFLRMVRDLERRIDERANDTGADSRDNH
jgi:hypothetical protein